MNPPRPDETESVNDQVVSPLAVPPVPQARLFEQSLRTSKRTEAPAVRRICGVPVPCSA